MMLTYSHNHAPGILLWQCSCHRNEKQNSESFFNYDANLTSVITLELKFVFFTLRCWFLCITSLAVTSSMLKAFMKFWGTSFKFWLRLCFPVSFENDSFSHSKCVTFVYLFIFWLKNNHWNTSNKRTHIPLIINQFVSLIKLKM